MEAFVASGAQGMALPPTGSLEPQAKKLDVLVKLNNELLRFASVGAEGLVRFDMARAAGLKADLTMLEGFGDAQIRRLTTYPGTVPHTALSLVANGDTFLPQGGAVLLSQPA